MARPIPASMHSSVVAPIFLTVNDYLKVQHRLQNIYHRLEVLNPKVTA